MEKKYESDMTPKEKRQLEAEKLKSMTFVQKVDYIWTYYKIVFAIPVAVIAAIYLGITIYQGTQENLVLSVAIVGGQSLSGDEIQNLEEEIKGWLGAEEKHDTVRIQANLPESLGDVSGNISLLTLVGAEALDILVCPEEIYEDYKKQGGLDEEALLYKNTGFIRETFGVQYEDVYITVLANAQQKDGAKAFMEYVQANAGQEAEIVR